ncbi:MAG: hypothetical protein ACRDT0_18190 [Pseudonocardiaceae bacterium]
MTSPAADATGLHPRPPRPALTVVAQPDMRTTAAARGLPAPGTRVVDRLVTDRTRHGVVGVYDEYWYQGMSFPVIFDGNGIWDSRLPHEVTIMPPPDDPPGGTR